MMSVEFAGMSGVVQLSSVLLVFGPFTALTMGLFVVGSCPVTKSIRSLPGVLVLPSSA